MKGVPLSIRKEFTEGHSKFDGKLLPLTLGSIYLVKVFGFHSISRILDKSNSFKKMKNDPQNHELTSKFFWCSWLDCSLNDQFGW